MGKAKKKGKKSKPVQTVQAPDKWVSSRTSLSGVRKPMAPPGKVHKSRKPNLLEQVFMDEIKEDRRYNREWNDNDGEY